MSTTIYFVIAGVGLAATALGISASAHREVAAPESDEKTSKKTSWKSKKPKVQPGKPWGKPVAIVGAIMLLVGLLQGLSTIMADATPSYIRQAESLQEQLLERHAEHLGVILGELAPGANILAINAPLLPDERPAADNALAATKANLPAGTMISAIAEVDWPTGATPSKGIRIRSGLPSWWTPADLKANIDAQPFPVGAILCFMPLPAELPASKLWNEPTMAWPSVILINPEPQGLETYIRKKIIKAAIVTLPGFQARALKEIPEDTATVWAQSKLVITLENIDEVIAKHPQLFAEPATPFDLQK